MTTTDSLIIIEMKISPVFNNLSIRNTVTTRSQNSTGVPVLERSPFVDEINFKSVKGAEGLRELLKYGIPDMYSDTILLDKSTINKILQHKSINGSLKEFVKFFSRYERNLQEVPKEIYGLIKQKAKSRNQKTVEQLVHEQYLPHHNKLLKIQLPILNNIEALATNLPDKEFLRIVQLLNTARIKLENRAHVEDFNPNDFIYRFNKLREGIRVGHAKKDGVVLNSLAFYMKDFVEVPKKKHSDTGITIAEANKINATVLKKMTNAFEKTKLKQNPEVTRLFIEANARIHKIPTRFPFNRKSFMYDLQEILDESENKIIAEKIKEEAAKLPTSKECVSAFIVKHAFSSSSKIIADMVNCSRGTIDHLLPIDGGGQNVLGNYGLASEMFNNERSNSPLEEQFRLIPGMYKYCQKQINRYIELNNKGCFKKTGLSAEYITNFAKQLHLMSPQEKPFVADLSKLIV